MWGAIIGDLAGSIYEFEQIKSVSSIKINEIIPKNAFFSDDTILTVAIADAIQNNKDYKPDIKPYFKTSFSPGFIKWCNSNEVGNSIGNGAMMRISPIGFYFENEKEVKENARLATISSHNSKEAIVYSTLVALIIFYAKQKMPKEEIIKKLNIDLKFEPFKKFNTTCGQTFNNCVYAAFYSNNFEESIKTVLSYGGDTDTNACITGAMAEALYGVDKELIKKVKKYIPNNFVNIIEKMYKEKENVELYR